MLSLLVPTYHGIPALAQKTFSKDFRRLSRVFCIIKAERMYNVIVYQ